MHIDALPIASVLASAIKGGFIVEILYKRLNRTFYTVVGTVNCHHTAIRGQVGGGNPI